VEPESLAGVIDKWLPPEVPDMPGETSMPTPNPLLTAARGLQTPSAAVFNRADFLARMMGDEELLRMIQETFLEDMPVQIKALEKLVARGEADLAAAQAHMIKGAAGNVSAGALREVAVALEKAGHDGDKIALQKAMSDLEHQFSRLKLAMTT